MKATILFVFIGMYASGLVLAAVMGVTNVSSSHTRHRCEMNTPIEYLFPTHALGCWLATPFEEVK